jgi:hypothetical protein
VALLFLPFLSWAELLHVIHELFQITPCSCARADGSFQLQTVVDTLIMVSDLRGHL